MREAQSHEQRTQGKPAIRRARPRSQSLMTKGQQRKQDESREQSGETAHIGGGGLRPEGRGRAKRHHSDQGNDTVARDEIAGEKNHGGRDGARRGREQVDGIGG